MDDTNARAEGDLVGGAAKVQPLDSPATTATADREAPLIERGRASGNTDAATDDGEANISSGDVTAVSGGGQAQPSAAERRRFGSEGRPALFMIQHGVAKKHNIGQLARCCTAFDVHTLCLIGPRALNTFGAHGADHHLNMRHFANIEGCAETLKREEGVEVVGIEIVDSAVPVQDFVFTGPTAFIAGNEGHGLSPAQKATCDRFIYIPQYGPGTASLNVVVATTIILHHFALWAGYKERQREGEKFAVAPRPNVHRTQKRGRIPLTPEEIEALRAQRAAKKAAAAEAAAQADDRHTATEG